jgi:hypothetical protein
MSGAFAARYPRVWHVTEAEGAGCEILYPAATLRYLASVPDDNANRDDFQRVSLPDGGQAVLRMQLMRDERLGPTLTGTFSGRPDLWRAHINRHVFFWVSEDRRDRFIKACARLRAGGAIGPGGALVVIELDTALLLRAHHEVAFFSLINTGSTVRGGARVRRDETTLRAVRDWRGERVVELAIRGSVKLSCDDGLDMAPCGQGLPSGTVGADNELERQ